MYYVRVVAESAAGLGPASAEIAVSVNNSQCAGPPGAPVGLVATVTGGTVVLSWNAASGSPATYVLEAGSAAGLSNVLVSDLGSVATSLSASAPPGSYYVRIRAKNSCGTGPASNEILVTVLPDGPIVLTGTQSLVLSGDVVVKNDIILHDNAVLTIQNATTSGAAFKGTHRPRRRT